MPEFDIGRFVMAPRNVVWDVISDHEGFGQAAPNLSKVEVVEGDGLGMQRRCYNNAGKGWSETCTLWKPGQAYRFEVDTSDYPYPLKKMQGTWSVGDRDGGTQIEMHYVYEMNYRVLGAMLDPVFKVMFRRACNKILADWEKRIANQSAESGVAASA